MFIYAHSCLACGKQRCWQFLSACRRRQVRCSFWAGAGLQAGLPPGCSLVQPGCSLAAAGWRATRPTRPDLSEICRISAGQMKICRISVGRLTDISRTDFWRLGSWSSARCQLAASWRPAGCELAAWLLGCQLACQLALHWFSAHWPASVRDLVGFAAGVEELPRGRDLKPAPATSFYLASRFAEEPEIAKISLLDLLLVRSLVPGGCRFLI